MGNWEVGLIVDERLGQAAAGEHRHRQRSGGRPQPALGPLISKLLGVEKKAIRYERNGMRRSVSVLAVLEQPPRPGAKTLQPLSDP